MVNKFEKKFSKNLVVENKSSNFAVPFRKRVRNGGERGKK
jgi:hypothetical protein